MTNRPNILTFYSFKGGVGRTMALVNCAYALAASGRNVLVMDMDLEAPGLSRFLLNEKEITYTNKSDILSLIEWAKGLLGKQEIGLEFLRTKSPPLENFIASVDPKKLTQPKLGTVGRLDILPARTDQDTYVKTLEDLNLPALTGSELCKLSDILRGYLKTRTFTIPAPAYYGPDVETRHTYDYVLVDSRTGLTEIGGLCVGPLADCLVILLSLNHQNVQGTADFLRTIGYPDAQKAKPIIVVPSPVPVGEMKAKTKRINILKKALKVDETADPLTYHPSMAIIESIFVRDNPDEYLSFEYEKLTDRLLAQFQDEPDQLAESSWKHLNNKKYREATEDALRIVARDPAIGTTCLTAVLNAHVPTDDHINSTLNNGYFVALDRVCRILANEQMQGRAFTLAIWNNILLSWADAATGRLKESRIAQVTNVCTTILDMGDISPKVKAVALGSLGWVHYGEGRFEESIEESQKALELEADHIAIRNNLGLALIASGQTDRGLDEYRTLVASANDADELKKTSIDDLQNAIEKYPDVAEFKTALDMVQARIAELRAK